ncbi:hypothetical protein K431DRAFT_281501 [Polychaeton citri CBS 116435]|uniref:RRM domain-containing protein n=1 Tax=Polychaeton citri CBS 116435 TaxID=1314669 RepID=A0A9P4QHL4_9PEZI|nr:hypothetical protein K431DRAFT_281501 [Polychaeton citri CBS 116435]
MSNTVHVKGISHQTSEKEVRDFFSFCGKIQSLSVTPESNDSSASQTASVTFEKETAAKTALLLDNTQLGPTQVSVTSAASLDQIAGDRSAASHDEPSDKEDISQEEKPRSRIVAEYLAHGYTISDKAIERAIALDQQHGVSNRFLGVLQGLDQKTKATERAQTVDSRYGITERAQAGWRGLSSYFEKAGETPTGQKIRAFYLEGQKQVLDVHNEALHLASLKKGDQKSSPESASATTTTGRSAEEAELEKIDESGHTKCNCGGVDGKCPCEPGKCACTGCSKAS